jgi:hypothetical protein
MKTRGILFVHEKAESADGGNKNGVELKFRFFNSQIQIPYAIKKAPCQKAGSISFIILL